jgi:hypothetical protein
LDIGISPISIEYASFFRIRIGKNLPENNANGEIPCVNITALAFALLDG